MEQTLEEIIDEGKNMCANIKVIIGIPIEDVKYNKYKRQFELTYKTLCDKKINRSLEKLKKFCAKNDYDIKIEEV